jgi:hypothetical protein
LSLAVCFGSDTQKHRNLKKVENTKTQTMKLQEDKPNNKDKCLGNNQEIINL